MSADGRPRRFGRYLLVRALAKGGMGQVFLAVQPGPHGVARPCVLKLIRAELAADQELVQRFIEEARVLVSLSHRNIVQIHEFGQVGNEYFMAMEYVEGVSVAALLREGGPLPVALALLVAREMLSALACAHGHLDPAGHPAEIVHRDVSPSNVLVSLAGDVKLVDFGLAMSRDRDRLTLPGLVVGTRDYRAPEILALAPATPQSDLYAVGACLYQMLTGLRLSEVRQSAAGAPGTGFLPPPSAHRREIPARLDEICLQALHRQPAGRHASAEVMRRDLQLLLARVAPAADGDALAQLVRERAGHLVPPTASWQGGEVAALSPPGQWPAATVAGGAGRVPERSLAVSSGRPPSSGSALWRGREIVTGVLRLDLEPLTSGEESGRGERLRAEWEDRTWVDRVPTSSGGEALSVGAFVMPVSSNPAVTAPWAAIRASASGSSSSRPPSSGRIAARRWASSGSSSRRVVRPARSGHPFIWSLLLVGVLAAAGWLLSPDFRAALQALLATLR